MPCHLYVMHLLIVLLLSYIYIYLNRSVVEEHVLSTAAAYLDADKSITSSCSDVSIDI
jgi:hypothetical protein